MKLPEGVMIDHIMNGRALGNSTVAARILATGGDPHAHRPYMGEDGQSYLDIYNGREYEAVVQNAPASLRFQDWRLIDEVVEKVAKPNLRFVGDLRSRGLEVTLPNGMAHTVFSFERASDTSAAEIAMSPRVRTQMDRQVFDITNLPLPLIHKDCSLDIREILASRNGSTPLDLSSIETATERVSEAAESLALGVLPTYTYGGGTVYGVTNFPARLTKTITAPTAPGWTPATMVQEALAMKLQSQLAYHGGPWMVYCSPNLDPYLDEDYSPAKGSNTLRQRIGQINGIMGVETVDWFQFLTNTPYTFVMLEMKPRTIREVVALDTVAVQWDGPGGFEWNAKVMCIMVPQLRADMNSNTGIVHGSASYP